MADRVALRMLIRLRKWSGLLPASTGCRLLCIVAPSSPLPQEVLSPSKHLYLALIPLSSAHSVCAAIHLCINFSKGLFWLGCNFFEGLFLKTLTYLPEERDEERIRRSAKSLQEMHPVMLKAKEPAPRGAGSFFHCRDLAKRSPAIRALRRSWQCSAGTRRRSPCDSASSSLCPHRPGLHR